MGEEEPIAFFEVLELPPHYAGKCGAHAPAGLGVLREAAGVELDVFGLRVHLSEAGPGGLRHLAGSPVLEILGQSTEAAKYACYTVASDSVIAASLNVERSEVVSKLVARCFEQLLSHGRGQSGIQFLRALRGYSWNNSFNLWSENKKSCYVTLKYEAQLLILSDNGRVEKVIVESFLLFHQSLSNLFVKLDQA